MGMNLDFADEVERAQLLKSVAILPSPRAVAWSLPKFALMALVHAERGRNGEYRLRDGVREMRAGEILFSAGIVESRGPYIGNFGMQVRRVALEMAMEGDL